MEFQQIVNLCDTAFDDKDLPRFVTKNGLKFMINISDFRISGQSLIKSSCHDS